MNKLIVALVVSGATAGMVGCCESYDKCGDAEINSSNQSTNAAKPAENPALPIEATVVKKVIHFAYNKYDLNAEAEEIIASLTKELLENPNLRLALVGHTDARGNQKYNLALGKLRARAVARALGIGGVAADRITVLSYGKAEPIAVGNDESYWSQNRRVELIYEGGT